MPTLRNLSCHDALREHFGLPSSSSAGLDLEYHWRGINSITASNIACTPLFLNAEPHIIGTISEQWYAYANLAKYPLQTTHLLQGTYSSTLHWLQQQLQPCWSAIYRIQLLNQQEFHIIKLHTLRSLIPKMAFILIKINHALKFIFTHR
jgi:hypothetical protein